MTKPPYTITSQILTLVSDIQALVGEAKHLIVKKPSVKLRKEKKIKLKLFTIAWQLRAIL
jgi:hypothetical protein